MAEGPEVGARLGLGELDELSEREGGGARGGSGLVRGGAGGQPA